MSFEYAIILAFMGRLKDRFSFYQKERTVEEKIALASQVEGVSGVEMVYPNDFSDVAEVKGLLQKYHLHLVAVNVDLKGDPRWHRGALTSSDSATRQEAVQWLRCGMDIAAELEANLVTCCPLADGHDYPFEIDYARAWQDFIDCLRAAAQHRDDVRLSLEYKQSEPRARVILPSASKALYALCQIDRPNVGVTLDMGHALYAGESCAESVALLAQAGKLFLVHTNDNYRNWDWDLIPGTVNFWDLIESIYYLRRMGYEGVITFDVFPARLDPVKTMEMSLRMCHLAESLVDQIGMETLARSIETGDFIQTMALIQSYLEKGA
jgi:xylose isomerase